MSPMAYICLRFRRSLKLLILVTLMTLLCPTLYYFFPAIRQEWVLWRLVNSNYETSTFKSDIISHVRLPEFFKGKQLPFHQIFEPRKVAFVDYNYTRGSKPVPVPSPKVILLWTPWNGVWNTINYYFLKIEDASFKNCPNTNCWVTRDKSMIHKSDAVLFHLLDLPDAYPIYRSPHQRWIGYIMEAPWQVHKNLTEVNGLFNWTMSYREDSDVVVKYGFVGPRLQSQGQSRGLTKPKDVIPFEKKRSVVWFVSDCKTDSKREEYVKELGKYIDVDIYGLCGTKKCFPAQSSVCYEDILIQYKFYLSFENSICKDYVTEKFFNILEYNIVPIVFGGADYVKIGPKGGFIDATKFHSPETLASVLKRIASQSDVYDGYLKWKETQRAYLHPWMCYLCDKLHEKPSQSIKEDLNAWWMKEGQCKKWVKTKGIVKLNY